MGRESTITIEQVSIAAQNLQAQGIKPTSRGVLAIIGYGSMGTILKLLQQWQSNQSNKSKLIENSIDPAIASAINNTLATRIQEATAEVTIKLANLQIETDNIITENERQTHVIETQVIEHIELQAMLATSTGCIHQLELEAIRIKSELTAERQSAAAMRISLAEAELGLEAMPKIELQIEKLLDEIDALKIKAAEFHESEAVALAKMGAAHQSAQEARDAAIKSSDATEAVREKYEKLIADALDKERTSAKLLESERLRSLSLQLRLETSMHELATADINLKEARVAAQKSSEEYAKSTDQHIQAKANSTDHDILIFNQNEPSRFNELDYLGVY